MSTQKKVMVHWDAAGLRAVPDEIKVNSRTEVLLWELKSDRRSARITDIAFEEDATGPFATVARSSASDVGWKGEGSRERPYEKRYKYSVFVTDSNGVVVELDPFVVDTDKP